MKINQIEYVFEVARCGNMTAAAANLFVTQPTLSQQIINLETELGVKLFTRMPRSMLLTPAGEEFMIYAKRILSDLKNLNVAMEDYAKVRKGKIRIGMLSTFGCLNIINKLSIFKRENPEIETIITVDQSKNLVEKLVSHELDVTFIIVSAKLPEAPNLDLFKLFDNEMMILLPQNHPLGRQKRVSFDELEGQNIIMPAPTSNMYDPLRSAFIGAGVEPRIICETSHPELFVQMVANGMGVAFASERVAAANRHHSFVARPLRPNVAQSLYYAVLKDSYDIPVIQRFSDYVIRENEYTV